MVLPYLCSGWWWAAAPPGSDALRRNSAHGSGAVVWRDLVAASLKASANEPKRLGASRMDLAYAGALVGMSPIVYAPPCLRLPVAGGERACRFCAPRSRGYSPEAVVVD